jgi:hypothetical protein
MRIWCITTFNDNNDKENDNQSVWQWENFILTRFWKEHDETKSQNSHRFSNELADLNLWVLSQSKSLNSQCTRCTNVFYHLINIIDYTDKQISVVVTTIKKTHWWEEWWKSCMLSSQKESSSYCRISGQTFMKWRSRFSSSNLLKQLILNTEAEDRLCNMMMILSYWLFFSISW